VADTGMPATTARVNRLSNKIVLLHVTC
jgi:hypothetical protein